MTGTRPWQLSIWEQDRGAPFASLGVHLDLHTPTIDFHLLRWTVQLGRNLYWRRANALPGMRFVLGDRVLVSKAGHWNGHSDNCDHPHTVIRRP